MLRELPINENHIKPAQEASGLKYKHRPRPGNNIIWCAEAAHEKAQNINFHKLLLR
jgi:hypothetical protein